MRFIKFWLFVFFNFCWFLFILVDVCCGIWFVEMYWIIRIGFILYKMKKNRYYIDVNVFIGIFLCKYVKYLFIYVVLMMSLCFWWCFVVGVIVFIDFVFEDGIKFWGMCFLLWIFFENWCMIFYFLLKIC